MYKLNFKIKIDCKCLLYIFPGLQFKQVTAVLTFIQFLIIMIWILTDSSKDYGDLSLFPEPAF